MLLEGLVHRGGTHALVVGETLFICRHRAPAVPAPGGGGASPQEGAGTYRMGQAGGPWHGLLTLRYEGSGTPCLPSVGLAASAQQERKRGWGEDAAPVVFFTAAGVCNLCSAPHTCVQQHLSALGTAQRGSQVEWCQLAWIAAKGALGRCGGKGAGLIGHHCQQLWMAGGLATMRCYGGDARRAERAFSGHGSCKQVGLWCVAPAP